MNDCLTVDGLRTEYAQNPLGLDIRTPRLSWQLKSLRRGAGQSAYQIRVMTDEQALESGSCIAWNSGKIISTESILRAYGGAPLRSRQRYYWQVRVWDERDAVSQWSAPEWWEMGLLNPSDWTANWIESASSCGHVPMFRREFVLRDGCVSARVYVTSHGLYQLFLNGQRVGDDELTPGFTSYNRRLQYQTYDITDLVTEGGNAIGAMLGQGWYAGVVGIGAEWNNRPHRYGEHTALLMQLEATYRDGTCERIVTDEGCKSCAGPILMSGIYAGETYDARLEQPGWNQPGFDDSSWNAVKVAGVSTARLVAQSSPLVRKIETIIPVSIVRTSQGDLMVDMGQNMVGWVRLSVKGLSGLTVTLRHGEVLDAEGNLYTANLGNAAQTVMYTLKGQGVETFEPHFTFHGLRYVLVQGYPGEITPRDAIGVVVHSAIEPRSEFDTSNTLLNRLHRNIIWGQKGNFVDIPSDCPQRDERLGWTGDAQIFAPTAAYNANVASFFGKWLKDLAADQYPNGSVPWVVPDVLGVIEGCPSPAINGKAAAGAAGWGDAVTVIPWAMYQTYGDTQFLQDNYASMLKWVQYERQRAGPDLIWRGDFQFGDWAAFDGGSTDSDLVATAYFAHSVDLLSRSAHALNKGDESAYYARLFADVTEAFNREFVTAEGEVGDGTQSAYVLALQFGLLPERQRPAAAKHLVESVRTKGYLTTGFLGTPWLLFALSEYGYLEDAYRLLLRQNYPSWLYAITRGATTIWERWDGIDANGVLFKDPHNNSFNHYAYGAVGEWMYRVIGGINFDPASPGYKHSIVKPRPGGGLTHAKSAHVTPYGNISASWKAEKNAFDLQLEIPANTSATVHLFGAQTEKLLEGGEPAIAGNGIVSIAQEASGVAIEVRSGQFHFSYSLSV